MTGNCKGANWRNKTSVKINYVITEVTIQMNNWHFCPCILKTV
jgi:hypothetical protein